MFTPTKLHLAVAGCLACSVAVAAEPTVKLTPDEIETANVMLVSPVVVTATRVEQSSFDLPVSIDVVDSARIHEQQLQTNLSETLSKIPGISVQNRQNYAQDLQVSSRGFGARAPFGVKGIRIIVDDIPATMPDGQGQGATITLGSTDHIEIMRGPFSALYGNGAGGVIQAFTENPGATPMASASFAAGSYGTHREELKASAQEGPVGLLVDVSTFNTDGYRLHSAAEREQVNAKITWDINDSTRLKLTATSLHQPTTQDPLGLSKTQVSQSRTQVDASALSFDTKKSIDYSQAGAVLETEIDNQNSIKIITYYGQRAVIQYQAVAVGGVVTLGRDFEGLNLRYQHSAELLGQPLKLTAGLDYDRSSELRRQFNNTGGVSGTSQSRNEDDTVYNLDPYVQASLQLGKDWEATAGVRYNNVNFNMDDHFNAAGSASYNTGSVTYTKATPSLGVIYHASPAINFYANAGQGFETPTFAEMTYSLNADGTVNTNKSTRSLKPSTSTTYEFGTKAFIGDNSRINLALFTTRVSNEIGAANNSFGKIAYQNVPKTQRNGLEASIDSQWNHGFSTYLAYTYLDAYVDQTYAKKLAGVSQTILSGYRIPGVAKNSLYGEVQWRYQPAGFSTAIETNWHGKVYANDINDASGLASTYVTANLRAGFTQNLSHWKLSEFARVDNVFDRAYIGSVIINDSNARYFEPSPGRTWLLGLNASYKF